MGILGLNCRQCHGCLKKLDNLPQNLKVLQISLRDTYGAPAKKEQIISQEIGNITNFNLFESILVICYLLSANLSVSL